MSAEPWPGWLVLAGIGCHYVAYSFFYSTWGAYGLETLPLVIVLAATGLVSFCDRARQDGRPALALVTVLSLAAALAFDARELPRFVARRRADTAYHRDLARLLDRVGETPAIVFMRLDPAREHPYDPIVNLPDLSAAVLRVLDLRERNAELLDAFPDRRAHLWDEAQGTLEALPEH